MLFDYGALHSFIAASVVIELGLEVEALEEPLYVSSPLGIRVRIGMICRGCKLEILRILLIVDLRVMDMSEFGVILGMDWLTAYRVVIVTPQNRGSVDNPSTRGIVVDVGLPDTTHENRAESPLYRELYPRYITGPKQHHKTYT